MSSIHITYHAAERFVQRHRPDLNFKQAMTFLIQNAPLASPLKERTHRGHQQRVLEEPYCVLVIKHDRAMRKPVCVTILPEPESDDPITEEEMDIIRERLAQDLKKKSGVPNQREASRVLYRAPTAPKPDLIKPSVNEKAEERRVLLEHRLWNRALDSYAKHQRELTRLETHYLSTEKEEDTYKAALIINLRRLIMVCHETGNEDLLRSVDKEFLRENFLFRGKVPNAPNLVQYSRSPCKTGILNQCTMTTKTWLDAGQTCEGRSVDGAASRTSQEYNSAD